MFVRKFALWMGSAVDFDRTRNQSQKIMIDIHNMQLQQNSFKKKTSCLAKRLTPHYVRTIQVFDLCMCVFLPSSDNNWPPWAGGRWRRCWGWYNLGPRRRWRHYIRWRRRQSVGSWNGVVRKRWWHIRNRRYWKIWTRVKWWRIRADFRRSSSRDVNFWRGRNSRYLRWSTRRLIKTRQRRRKLRRAWSRVLVG